MDDKSINCSMFVTDEKIQTALKAILSEFYSFEIDSILRNRSEALEYLTKHKSPILILDLEMHEILNLIQKPPYVVGVGTVNGYKKIKDCLGQGFSDFIFLPIEKDNVQNVMSKILNIHGYLLSLTEHNSQVHELPASYNEDRIAFQTDKDFIFIQDKKNGYCRLFCDEILFAQSVGNEMRVVLEKGSPVYDKKNLKNFVKQLPASKFLKINRSTVVNCQKINRIDKKMVTIKNQSFKVTRTFYKGFLLFFDHSR